MPTDDTPIPLVGVEPPAPNRRRWAGLFAPWRRGRVLLALLHVSLDLCLGALTFSVAVSLVVVGVGLTPVIGVGLPVLWLLLVATPAFTTAERSRYASLLGVRIPDGTPGLTADTWFGRQWQVLSEPRRWTQVLYQVLLLGLGLVALVPVSTWIVGLILLAAPLIHAAIGRPLQLLSWSIDTGPEVAGLAGIGLVTAAVVAPWMTMATAWLDTVTARALLGPGAGAAEARAQEAEQRRRAVVDAADLERRRIERDLHDGVQARLVALGMELGLARRRLAADPAEGEAVVGAAHDEIRAVIADLRAVVRGIQPAILEDRGLDPALSSVVARLPFPVSVAVSDRRFPRPVELTAYYVVTEALTNVAKHAGATRAEVTIRVVETDPPPRRRAGRRGRAGGAEELSIVVGDDGHGGAAAGAGSGLAGLQDRVRGLGGRMTVVSPPGGPTTIEVGLPCE
ncbi:MAG: sensor domain-containing protein [Acidimicrobiales bacterium]